MVQFGPAQPYCPASGVGLSHMHLAEVVFRWPWSLHSAMPAQHSCEFLQRCFSQRQEQAESQSFVRRW